jgi:hypothetical protein
VCVVVPTDANPELPPTGLPYGTYQLVLNLGSARADAEPMGSIVDDEPGGIGAGGLRARPRHRSGSSAELAKLREKVSLLSMQKEYWWHRYTEGIEECRAAQREVAELKQALAELQAGHAPDGGTPPRRAYVDPRLLS